MLSPILPVQKGDTGYILQRTKREIGNGFWLNFKAYRDGYVIKSIEQAENAYLACAEIADEIWEPRFAKGFWMACALRRQGAYIARRSRRGFANLCLMHPNMVRQIVQHNHLVTVSSEAPKAIGRWTRSSESFDPKIVIYCADHLPTDEAYMLFVNGNADVGAIILENNQGNRKLIMQDQTECSGPDFYATRVRFSG
jgi:hypothetical protein